MADNQTTSESGTTKSSLGQDQTAAAAQFAEVAADEEVIATSLSDQLSSSASATEQTTAEEMI